jgi:hypothetical protein
VTSRVVRIGRGRLLLAGLIAAPFVAGCSPEGAGTVKIENAEAVRSKFTGEGNDSGKAATPKQAAAKAAVEEAGKKNPKLK